MFQLTKEETAALRFHFETSKRGGDRYQPYAFTELGVSMLSSILNSPQAIQMNILIMRTFVLVRKNAQNYLELAEEIAEIRKKVGNHTEQLNLLYEAIENFMDEKAETVSWQNRERIGFRP
jgi:hypothetical protein